MLDDDEREQAISALLEINHEYVKRIYRMYKDIGKVRKPIEVVADEIIDYFGEDLFCHRKYGSQIREHLTRSICHKDDKESINELLELLDVTFEGGHCKDLAKAARLGRWVRGGPAALVFTNFFGFPSVYAGERIPTRVLSNPEEVSSFERAPKLHDYQEHVMEELKDTIGGVHRSRCMFTLPTGAGKTRVLVDFLVDHINEKIRTSPDSVYEGLILWVAHSEELCEQALETMKWVWQSRGKGKLPLSIYRHHSGFEIPVDPFLSGIIVASIQKVHSTLKNDMKRGVLSNLKSSLDFIIIDEAHRSKADSYRMMIDKLGDDCHIIGLSATPFRTDTGGTAVLERIYQSNLVGRKTIDGENIFDWLQKEGYLCPDIQQRELVTGVTVKATADDRKQGDQFNQVSGRLLRELAEDEERNQKIIERILELYKGPDGISKKILLFACTVDHCWELKRRLDKKRIDAAVITGMTSQGRRWKYIQQFKKGDIKVLINFGVLTMGFDDPGIDVILVARPTLSRVLYTQMIGRGLRGPKNGGTELCLIIDVKDHIDNYNFNIQKYEDYRNGWKRGN